MIRGEVAAIRPRITKVGSSYRREGNSGTCELCFVEWTAMIRDISFRLDAADGDRSWEATVSTFHEGSWNDNWEVEVDPFVLSAALARVTLAVDQALLDNPEGPAFIAREILEAAAPRFARGFRRATAVSLVHTGTTPDRYA